MGSRGPKPEEDSTRAQKRELQSQRKDEGIGSRGPKPDESSSHRAPRRERQAARAEMMEDGAGSRGPKPVATEVQQRGYPFPNEEKLSPEQVQAHFVAFVRSWCKFGLSRVCEGCWTLTPARHLCLQKATGKAALQELQGKSDQVRPPGFATRP